MFFLQFTSIFDMITQLESVLISLSGLAISSVIGPHNSFKIAIGPLTVKEFERREVSTLLQSFMIGKKQRFNKTIPISGSFCTHPNQHLLQRSIKSFYQAIEEEWT